LYAYYECDTEVSYVIHEFGSIIDKIFQGLRNLILEIGLNKSSV